jgi:hypothetical protein
MNETEFRRSGSPDRTVRQTSPITAASGTGRLLCLFGFHSWGEREWLGGSIGWVRTCYRCGKRRKCPPP